MHVLVLVKPSRLDDPFLREVLTTGVSRGHRVRPVDKRELLATPMGGVDVVCLKNHVDDDTVWRALDEAGVRAVNRRLSCSLRSEVDAMAARAGVLTPRSARDEREVEGLGYPVVRKSASLFAAAEPVVLDRPPAQPDCATYFYQELVPHDGVTAKVYGIGSQVFLVEEQDHVPADDPRRRRQAMLPDPLADAARAVGTATCLEVYGTDFVGVGEEQYLVDVNPFPSFRHVEQAASALWTHLERASA